MADATAGKAKRGRQPSKDLTKAREQIEKKHNFWLNKLNGQYYRDEKSCVASVLDDPETGLGRDDTSSKASQPRPLKVVNGIPQPPTWGRGRAPKSEDGGSGSGPPASKKRKAVAAAGKSSNGVIGKKKHRGQDAAAAGPGGGDGGSTAASSRSRATSDRASAANAVSESSATRTVGELYRKLDNLTALVQALAKDVDDIRRRLP